MEQSLKAALAARQNEQLFRSRLVLDSAQGAEVHQGDIGFLNFSSNDYLGLANHPRIKQAFIDAANRYGVGSGASHLVSGHSREHHLLEEALAEFTGRDRAVLFGSGYMANMGAITALLEKPDAIFEDRLNHASLLDAGLLSGARFQRFLHNDLDNLQNRLERSEARRKLIVVDGVFSMDGDCAPLPDLAQTAAQNDAWLMVDDAHGFGVLGSRGAGCVERDQLGQNEVPVLMATLGKALGTYGAFVAGSETLIETLIQFSRNYIYTTAMPAAVAAASRVGLNLLQEEAWRREKLQSLIAQFRLGAAQIGLTLMPSETAIQPLVVGSAEATMKASEALKEKGLLVGAIRPPTVAAGSSRLRITLNAAHSEIHVERLLSSLDDLGLATKNSACDE